jgi:hypothetical protein
VNSDIIFVAGLAAVTIFIAYQLSRILRTAMLHRSVREAIRADASIVPQLLDKIDEPRDRGGGDDRTGLILIALGAAVFGFGLIQGEDEAIRGLSGLALFPTFVGVVLAGRHWFLRRRGADR